MVPNVTLIVKLFLKIYVPWMLLAALAFYHSLYVAEIRLNSNYSPPIAKVGLVPDSRMNPDGAYDQVDDLDEYILDLEANDEDTDTDIKPIFDDSDLSSDLNSEVSYDGQQDNLGSPTSNVQTGDEHSGFHDEDVPLEGQPQIEMYPSLKEMKSMIINGTYDWSKTARSILFLKKHKCASSTLREALRNYLHWRGLTEEVSIFQALGGCYPSRWDPKCRPSTELKSHVRNILYHHRLNLDEQLPLMFPDTKLITTVREPVSLLYRNFSVFPYVAYDFQVFLLPVINNFETVLSCKEE